MNPLILLVIIEVNTSRECVNVTNLTNDASNVKYLTLPLILSMIKTRRKNCTKLVRIWLKNMISTEESSSQNLDIHTLKVWFSHLDVDQQKLALVEFAKVADQRSGEFKGSRAILEELALSAIDQFFGDSSSGKDSVVRLTLTKKRPHSLDQVHGRNALLKAYERSLVVGVDDKKLLKGFIELLGDLSRLVDFLDAIESETAAYPTVTTKIVYTCCACLNKVEMKGGRIEEHYHFLLNLPSQKCTGANYPPLELAPGSLKLCIEALKTRLSENEAAYASRFSKEAIKVGKHKIDRNDERWDDEFTKYVMGLEHLINSLKHHLDKLARANEALQKQQ